MMRRFVCLYLWTQANGMDATKEKFEKHWREYCSDEDLDWLVNEAKCKFSFLFYVQSNHPWIYCRKRWYRPCTALGEGRVFSSSNLD